ncbi:endonuclease/exonuclease/phosphatase family protein [Candidatus Parabeggiatoa sp. HSG14]|uniref:endonuclease/exonuclease/phosphatase family protein n=1 Tax=Candidatus Parabeggiatoa sp. HSG14 TaxID=3055593 RepID=UPI0025A7C619|nr:hypothetical protein [Thiotrichales bacterium HSG14]
MNFLPNQINQHQFIRFAKFWITIGTIFAILLAIIGHLIRDHVLILALMMYIPLLPLGLWTILLDLWQNGRSLPKLRFGLTLIGITLTIWGAIPMIGIGNAQTNIPPNAITLMHWNVKWGGIGYDNYIENRYNGEEWPSIRKDIEQRRPEIVILSEPPQLDSWLTQLTEQLGAKWSMKRYRTKRNGFAVFSLWPLQFERFMEIRNGVAMSVVVTVRDQALRLLLVDGERSIRKIRTPLLTDIIQIVIEADKQGKPVDLIIGDFNAVSRSIGFDTYAVAAGGYQLAGKAYRGWRATWPSFLPLLDIDHVWIHKRFQIFNVEMWHNFYTDHRGQMIYFKPKPKAEALDSWNPKL